MALETTERRFDPSSFRTEAIGAGVNPFLTDGTISNGLDKFFQENPGLFTTMQSDRDIQNEISAGIAQLSEMLASVGDDVAAYRDIESAMTRLASLRNHPNPRAMMNDLVREASAAVAQHNTQAGVSGSASAASAALIAGRPTPEQLSNGPYVSNGRVTDVDAYADYWGFSKQTLRAHEAIYAESDPDFAYNPVILEQRDTFNKATKIYSPNVGNAQNFVKTPDQDAALQGVGAMAIGFGGGDPALIVANTRLLEGIADRTEDPQTGLMLRDLLQRAKEAKSMGTPFIISDTERALLERTEMALAPYPEGVEVPEAVIEQITQDFTSVAGEIIPQRQAELEALTSELSPAQLIDLRSYAKTLDVDPNDPNWLAELSTKQGSYASMLQIKGKEDTNGRVSASERGQMLFGSLTYGFNNNSAAIQAANALGKIATLPPEQQTAFFALKDGAERVAYIEQQSGKPVSDQDRNALGFYLASVEDAEQATNFAEVVNGPKTNVIASGAGIAGGGVSAAYAANNLLGYNSWITDVSHQVANTINTAGSTVTALVGGATDLITSNLPTGLPTSEVAEAASTASKVRDPASAQASNMSALAWSDFMAYGPKEGTAFTAQSAVAASKTVYDSEYQRIQEIQKQNGGTFTDAVVSDLVSTANSYRNQAEAMHGTPEGDEALALAEEYEKRAGSVHLEAMRQEAEVEVIAAMDGVNMVEINASKKDAQAAADAFAASQLAGYTAPVPDTNVDPLTLSADERTRRARVQALEALGMPSVAAEAAAAAEEDRKKRDSAQVLQANTEKALTEEAATDTAATVGEPDKKTDAPATQTTATGAPINAAQKAAMNAVPTKTTVTGGEESEEVQVAAAAPTVVRDASGKQLGTV